MGDATAVVHVCGDCGRDLDDEPVEFLARTDDDRIVCRCGAEFPAGAGQTELGLAVSAEIAALENGEGRRMPAPHNWTYDEARHWLHKLSGHIGEWEGLPVPLGKDCPLVLRKRHHMAGFFDGEQPDAPDDDGERVINSWYDLKRSRQVYVVETDQGRREARVVPTAPDRSMDRFMLWANTLTATDAWEMKAEYRAREHLRAMLTERQWRHYDLTGAFVETSQRSKLVYMFRRLRPTIVLSPRTKDDPAGAEDDHSMRCVAVLCLHPIGYYANSWAGCMVPTDDVIAHLTLMRANEAGFWKQAIQHQPADAEAGI